MKKTFIKLMMVMAALLPSVSFGVSELTGVFNAGNTGTTSATVFVAPGSEYGNITDLATRLDSGVTTGQVIFRAGDVQYASTSATTATQKVVWFANTATSVASGEYIIIYNVTSAQPSGSGTYLVRQVGAATTTSVTVTENISPALTTSDQIWSVPLSVSRPAGQVNSATTSALGSIWIPRGKPVAITVDGNTTACSITVSGIRCNYK